MANKKGVNPQQITQGGINITGSVAIKNSKVAGRDNIENKVVNKNFSFAPVYNAIQKDKTRSAKVRNTIRENVEQIEQEIKKGDEAKATFIQQRIKNIQEMAPDIADVVIATLQNPAAGISLAINKVLKKAQAPKK